MVVLSGSVVSGRWRAGGRAVRCSPAASPSEGAGRVAERVEPLARDGGDEVGRERVVAAVVEVLERRDREQRVQLARDRRPGQVEVEAAEVAQDVDRRDRPPAARAKPSTRSAMTGSVAPACGTMRRRFGWRATVPLSTRFTTARVVSNRNSSIGRGRPNDVCSQQTGDVGWMSTRAPRRSSSREHGSQPDRRGRSRRRW